MIAEEIKSANELEHVVDLLRECKLPYQDVALGKDKIFITYYKDNDLIGTGGLEVYSDYSLLRSVAIRQQSRGHSFGKEIVNDLIRRATASSIKEVYLLTETAHDFFIKLGFKDVSREQVPDAVKASTEFSSVCPVSASCMVYCIED